MLVCTLSLLGACCLFRQVDASPGLERTLIDVAHRSIVAEVTGRPYTAEGQTPTQAVFVTIERAGTIRGCRGDLLPRARTLEQEVALAAKDAAMHDPRYRPLSKAELKDFLVTVTLVQREEPVQTVIDLQPSEGLVLRGERAYRCGPAVGRARCGHPVKVGLSKGRSQQWVAGLALQIDCGEVSRMIPAILLHTVLATPPQIEAAPAQRSRLSAAQRALLGSRAALAHQVHDVHLAVSKDVAPSDKIQININTQNVRSIVLTAQSIDGQRWFTLEQRHAILPSPIAGTSRSWPLAVASAKDPVNPNQADTFYSRQINLPKLPPGVYLLNASGGDKPAWTVVNVTNLAAVVKRSSKHALAWVTDFRTGKTIPGAQIESFNLAGQKVQQAPTGSNGAALLDMGPGEVTFIVRHGRDFAAIESQQANPDGRLVAHFETDRPTYRPGQKISFKAILRRTLGTGYRPVTLSNCNLVLRDPKDNPVEELKLQSNAMGTVSGDVEIPSEGMTGPYSLVLSNGRDMAYQTVSVAEYRKPEFQVDVKPIEKRYLAGQEIAFEVDSSYYFGAKVPQAQIIYQVRRTGMAFGGFDSVTQAFYSGDGNLYPRDTYSADATVAEDTAFTDANGRAIIRLKTDPGVGDATYQFSCTVVDASHRQVQGASAVPVYGAAVRLGLGSSLSFATLGSLIPVTASLVDLDGHPCSGLVKLQVKREVYDTKTGEEKEVLLTSTSVKVGPSGTYTINLPAKESGELKIYGICADGTGRTAKAVLELYVAGNYEPPVAVEEQPTLQIRLDKHEFKPGESGKALIQTNNPKRPILAVIEGEDIWAYQVLNGTSRDQNWTVVAQQAYAPNAYVTAAQWVKGQLISANVVMPVPDRTKALSVSLKPDKTTYKPGDSATFRVHTQDGSGKPVSAEIAVGVVDEAIYAVAGDQTSDLYRQYWGLRPNGVSMLSSAPEELSGGAYQRVNALAPVRQRFEDTAFWNPIVRTNASGNAAVTFEMPGNLTTWRTTARAVTLDTSVGTGSFKVIATRPVTLRLATPRQMVVGDHVQIIGTVDNRSASEHQFEVRLDASGLQIEGARFQQIKVAAHAEGKAIWSATATTIPPTRSASLAGQVEADGSSDPDLADALRVSVPIVPNGLPHRSVFAGSVKGESKTAFELPSDRIEGATSVKIVVRSGVRPVLQAAASSVLDSPRYGVIGAANQIEIASLLGLPSRDEHVVDSLALLERVQNPEGWGYWDGAPADPVITARVLSVLTECRARAIKIPDHLWQGALGSSVYSYQRTNLWEYRSLLASAVSLAGDQRGLPLLEEVVAHGSSMSPYARLRLAEGLNAAGKRDEAGNILASVLQLIDSGPDQSYLPAGEGSGWAGTDTEATAEALFVLASSGKYDSLQGKLARWLASEEQSWRSEEEDALVARALTAYLKTHAEDSKLGVVTVSVNGTQIPVKASTVDQSVSVEVPSQNLSTGTNTVDISKSSSGEAFYSVETRLYNPSVSESTTGIRVLRRFEVKNAGGMWVELNRPIKIGEPVRCTVLAWGDNYRDAIKLSEPIPAGFEFVEDGVPPQGQQEVRDGAVVDYLVNSFVPQTFSYYLRSESESKLTILPAIAEYLRRPALRGNTGPIDINVVTK